MENHLRQRLVTQRPVNRLARIAVLALALLTLPGLAVAETAEAPLGPRLQATLARGTRLHRSPVGVSNALTRIAAATEVDIMIVGSPDPADLVRAGVSVGTRTARVITGRVAVGDLGRVRRIHGVAGIRLATGTERLLDMSLVDSRIDGLRTRTGSDWSGFTGEGVLVGLIDSGLDAGHQDFRTPEGDTRIRWFWNQLDAQGTPPVEIGTAYGSEWSAAQIDAGGTSAVDPVGHGTHVGGILAGDGSATGNGQDPFRYPGVAPKANLVVVATDLLDAHIIDAVAYVFAKADQAGMPAVVNLSLGTQFGPHDGTAVLDLAVEDLVGPGRLVVAAAGNAADDAIHGELVVSPGGTGQAHCTSLYPAGPAVDFNGFIIDAFYTRGDLFEVTVVTPGGARFGPYPLGAVQPDTLTGEGTLFLQHFDPGEPGTSIQVQVEISDTTPSGGGSAVPPLSGTWTLEWTAVGALPSGGEIDLWLPLMSPMVVTWEGDTVDPGEEIASPASSQGAIAVASYNTRRCWQSFVIDGTAGGERCSVLPPSFTEIGDATYFSSRGPTRDGRQKPEIAAPGFIVVSARAATIDPDLEPLFGLPETADEDGVHMVQAGTSMAAPHVAGTLALALAARPTLDPTTARDELIASARTDEFTGTEWTPELGHGKLDGTAFLARVPIRSDALTLSWAGTGVDLAWGRDAGSAGFRVDRRRRDMVRTVAAVSGPGPHRIQDVDALPGDVYLVYRIDRLGAVTLWAESNPVSPRPALWAAHPNPFRARTVLVLAPGESGEIDVYDVRGRVVRRLTPTGPEAVWDGRDDAGRAVPAGLYWFRAVDGAASVRVVRLP